jgi:hypothetical protein
MTSSFTFLPDALPALAAGAQPSAAGSTRRRAALDVAVTANGAPAGEPVPLSAEILGAGDIVALDRRMIARVDPPEAAAAFEPNYMPLVEFVDADFPWRYSLDTGSAGRRKPWLVLVVLQPDEFTFVSQGQAPLARIRVADAAKSLPDLTQSWAFAHVHVSLAGTSAPLEQFMQERPERHFSRLLCPRRLEANAAYSLFLVPAFEAGRLRGCGDESVPSPWNGPAWSGSSGPLELPVYFQSRFVTSALEDFELLVRRLQPYRVTPEDPVAKPAVAFAGEPGYYPGYRNPAATFEIQDALVKAGAQIEPFNTDPALTPQLTATLSATIAGESVAAGADGPDLEDPLVAMPAYGWRFRQETGPDEARAAAGEWFDRVSLDLKFRQAAGLGAETVRRNQERFAAICWQQYAEIVEANRRLSQLQTASLLAERLSARHYEKLPAEAAVALAEPLHAAAVVPAGRSVAATLREAGLPVSLNSRSLRIAAAKRARNVTLTPAARARVVPMPPVVTARAGRARRVRALPPRFRTDIAALLDVASLEEPLAEQPLAVGVRDVDKRALASTLADTLKALPGRKAVGTLAGLSAAEAASLSPVLRSPVVPIPLADELSKFAGSTLLRNHDALPPNSVAVVQENHAFVEAFLVGANHEMNNELRWREFPTDMRGTVLARFWNRGRAPDDPGGDDIPPIRSWSAPLGSNFPAGDPGGASFVLLLRSDFIRKLGAVEIVLTRLKDGASAWAPESVDSFASTFSGLVSTDTAYYGFDVARETVLSQRTRFFFAIYEPAGAFRFGLDIATASVRRSRFVFGTAALPFSLRALGRTVGHDPVPAHLKGALPVTGGAATWNELSWTDMILDDAGYVDFSSTRPLVSEPPPLWSDARTSASLARSFLQKPVAAVISAARVLR